MRRGYTLIEILVAIAIIGLVSSIAIPAYGAMTSRVVADNAAEELLTALRKTQNLSLTAQTGGNPSGDHTVAFTSNSSDYTIDGATYHLHDGAKFTSTGSVVFKKLTGMTTATTISLSSRGLSRTVTVAANGSVSRN